MALAAQRWCVAAVVVAALIAAASPASAAPRVAVVADPLDQFPLPVPPPDAREVRITSDAAIGRLEVTVSFYGSITTDTFTMSTTLTDRMVYAAPGVACGYGGSTPPPAASVAIHAPITTGAFGTGADQPTAELSGYGGALPASAASVSPDGRVATVVFQNAALANHRYACATRIAAGTDLVPDASSAVGVIAFADDYPSCLDTIDNDHDGAVDLADPGCLGNPLRTSEQDPAPIAAAVSAGARVRGCVVRFHGAVGPAIEPAALFGFGDVRVSFVGATARTRSVRASAIVPVEALRALQVKRVPRGAYDVHVRYLGDAHRLARIASVHVVVRQPICDGVPTRRAVLRYARAFTKAARYDKRVQRAAVRAANAVDILPDGTWIAAADAIDGFADQFDGVVGRLRGVPPAPGLRVGHACVVQGFRLAVRALRVLSGGLRTLDFAAAAAAGDRADRLTSDAGKEFACFTREVDAVSRLLTFGWRILDGAGDLVGSSPRLAGRATSLPAAARSLLRLRALTAPALPRLAGGR